MGSESRCDKRSSVTTKFVLKLLDVNFLQKVKVINQTSLSFLEPQSIRVHSMNPFNLTVNVLPGMPTACMIVRISADSKVARNKLINMSTSLVSVWVYNWEITLWAFLLLHFEPLYMLVRSRLALVAFSVSCLPRRVHVVKHRLVNESQASWYRTYLHNNLFRLDFRSFQLLDEFHVIELC
jgi:hypothetical protein